VIRGDRDTIVPQRWVEEVVQLLPKGKLIVIPRGTHATQYSSPDELAVAIESFLSDHASSG
jgi:pimeloyl-ACP methyl ester carboxylesterase